MNQINYETACGILGICKFKEKYLLLRFSQTYDYCPRDWDFIYDYISNSRCHPEKEVLDVVKKHTDLEGEVLKRYPVFEWIDDEFKRIWVFLPYLIKINNEDIELSQKFSEYKWLNLEEILQYDRLDYLKNHLERTLQK